MDSTQCSADIIKLIDSALGFEEKGGKGSGHHGHKGIKGQRGGSAPSKLGGELAKRDGTELYRWANLLEVVNADLGKRATSLDMTEDPDFYFAPPSAAPPGRTWVARTYGRFIFDKEELRKGGWSPDPYLRAESAWRFKPSNIGLRGEETPITKPLKAYMGAIQGYEVHQIPKGYGIEDVEGILKYRLGRDVPVSVMGYGEE